MRKRDELISDKSCLNKAGEDEPIFVLRAQDELAPDVVEYWIDCAVALDVDVDKVAAAKLAVEDMKAWQAEHGSKLPD